MSSIKIKNMKKVLILSSSADNMAPQLGFKAEDIELGNYKNLSETIEKAKSGTLRAIIVDSSLNSFDLYKIIFGLKRYGMGDSPEMRLIILGGEKEIDGAKTLKSITDLQKEFALNVS